MKLTASDYQSLEGSVLFRAMSLENLTEPLAACELVEYSARTTMLEPGRENRHIYVLLNGSVNVHLDGPDKPAHAELGPGDCVGEMSLVDGHPVSAWVMVTSSTRLLAMPHGVLWSLVERSHAVARNLLALLSGRVRTNNLTLVATKTQSLQFEESSSVDALTALHNRRWFAATMPRVLQRSERDGQPASLLVVDVDRFSQFASQVSPSRRDASLRTIATRLADGLRAQDMIARLHDDRFAIVLTRTEIDESLFIAERLREYVAACGIGPTDGAQLLTLSGGLAIHRVGESLDDLLVRAESALADAKANGRDCVETAH